MRGKVNKKKKKRTNIKQKSCIVMLYIIPLQVLTFYNKKFHH